MGDFPSDVFPNGNFPNVHNFPCGNFPKVRLGRLRRRREPNAAARADLESCRFGNCTLENLPLGKEPN